MLWDSRIRLVHSRLDDSLDGDEVRVDDRNRLLGEFDEHRIRTRSGVLLMQLQRLLVRLQLKADGRMLSHLRAIRDLLQKKRQAFASPSAQKSPDAMKLDRLLVMLDTAIERLAKLNQGQVVQFGTSRA